MSLFSGFCFVNPEIEPGRKPASVVDLITGPEAAFGPFALPLLTLAGDASGAVLFAEAPLVVELADALSVVAVFFAHPAATINENAATAQKSRKDLDCFISSSVRKWMDSSIARGEYTTGSFGLFWCESSFPMAVKTTRVQIPPILVVRKPPECTHH